MVLRFNGRISEVLQQTPFLKNNQFADAEARYREALAIYRQLT